MLPLGPVFKAYDVRGVVPGELDSDACRAIGAAFAAYAVAPRIVVGRDMRPTGTELAGAYLIPPFKRYEEILDIV